MIVTGAGWDTIQSGMGSDYIYAGTGNDYITLADDDLQDEIVYYFGKSSVSDGYRAADSGNKVRGFERGIDVLTLKVAADSGVTSTTLEEFLESNTGADGIKGNADDPFHVKFNFASDGNGGVAITGLVFAFTGGGTDASGRLGNAYFDIYFDNPMPLTTFLERVGKTDEIHAGAHDVNTNINPGFGSIIDLKKLDEIFGEDGLRFIPDAAPSPLFSTPSTALNGDAGNNNLSGTSADEMIQGGDGNDTITSGGGGDVIIGGAGDDTITLGAGSDTIIYRFESGDDGWTGTDGADTINNFNPNEDKFYFIDMNANDPITSFAALAAAAGKPAVTLTHPNTGVSFDYGLTSVTLTFDGGDDDATNDKVLSINFTDSYDGGIDQSNVTVIKGSDEYPETSQLDNYSFLDNVPAESDALEIIELSDLPDGLVIL